MRPFAVYSVLTLVTLASSPARAQVCSCGYPCDVLLEYHSIFGPESHTACLSIVAGPDLTLENSATVTLTAGEDIELGNGFAVDSGAQLVLEIDPTLYCNLAIDGDGDTFDACLDCDDDDPDVFPGASELCNGEDDDCDFVVDNGDPEGGEGCDTGLEGVCSTGTLHCVSGVLECIQDQAASDEICDNLDDDCDGAVDEDLIRSCYDSAQGCTGIPGGSYTCVGECRAGSQVCAGGVWGTCTGEITPVFDTCRDARDNDCDGSMDEICGDLFTYAVVSNAGTLDAGRNIITTSRITTGTYSVTAGSPDGCNDRMILVTPETSLLRATAFACSASDYVVRVGDSTGALADRNFAAVVTPNSSGHAWALVQGSTGTALRSYGSPVTSRVATGVYEIQHANCGALWRPVFTSIYSSSLVGYSVGYYYSEGICRVRTYNLAGELDDLSFGVWIPDPSTAAWATVSSGGSLVGSNDFSDQYANWSTTKVVGGSGFEYYDVRFPAWSPSSACVVGIRQIGDFMAGYLPATAGTRVYTYDVSSAVKLEAATSVIFVQ